MIKRKYTLKDLKDQRSYREYCLKTLDQSSDPYKFNTCCIELNYILEIINLYEKLDLCEAKSQAFDAAITKESEPLLHALERKYLELVRQSQRIFDTNKRQKHELMYINQNLADKNIKLDALHHIWCNPGCSRGIHRQNPHLKLTKQHVEYLNYHVSQINQVHYGQKPPKWWDIWGWMWRAKKLQKQLSALKNSIKK